MNDWRRLNVALTRAKHKLVIIGSLKLMKKVENFKKLIDLISFKNWIINAHVF